MNFIKSFRKKKLSSAIIVMSVILVVFFSCCSGNKTTKSSKKKATNTAVVKEFEILVPQKDYVAKLGDTLTLKLQNKDTAPDSISISFESKNIGVKNTGELEYVFNVEPDFVGTQNLQLTIYFKDSLIERHSTRLFVLPKDKPEQLKYKVIRSFDHDPSAYTQGLIYKDGFIYESTGRKKQSSLRKVDTKTGEVVKKKALDPEYFGEGIAIVGKEVYMITYISQVGFVYDAVTFDLIRKFNLQTREGWGLTTYGDELILSDGSASLYFFDPKYFSLNRQMEVCDNKGLVTKLNELEYTPSGLFANLYGRKEIALIDESTGIVKGYLDLSDLFPDSIPDNYDYVLNGIAFNYDTGTYYVTGKQWPVIYEIDITTD